MGRSPFPLPYNSDRLKLSNKIGFITANFESITYYINLLFLLFQKHYFFPVAFVFFAIIPSILLLCYSTWNSYFIIQYNVI